MKIGLALRAEKDPALILGPAEKYAHGLEVSLAVRCEVKKHAGVPYADSLEAGLTRERLDERDTRQEQELLGRRAVTVSDLVDKIVGILLRTDGSDASAASSPARL